MKGSSVGSVMGLAFLLLKERDETRSGRKRCSRRKKSLDKYTSSYECLASPLGSEAGIEAYSLADNALTPGNTTACSFLTCTYDVVWNLRI